MGITSIGSTEQSFSAEQLEARYGKLNASQLTPDMVGLRQYIVEKGFLFVSTLEKSGEELVWSERQPVTAVEFNKAVQGKLDEAKTLDSTVAGVETSSLHGEKFHLDESLADLAKSVMGNPNKFIQVTARFPGMSSSRTWSFNGDQVDLINSLLEQIKQGNARVVTQSIGTMIPE